MITFQDYAKERLPYLAAMAEGQQVQQRCDSGIGVWCEKWDFDFSEDGMEYRIKPERLECWAAMRNDGSAALCWGRDAAEVFLGDCGGRIAYMCEVEA